MDRLRFGLQDQWVVHQDDALIGVYKPPGVSGQPPSRKRSEGIADMLRVYLAERRGVSPEQVYLGGHQQLEQGASGVLLFALGKSANPSLERQARERALGRVFEVVVEDWPKDRTRAPRRVRHALVKGRDRRLRLARGSVPGARPGELRVLRVASRGRRSLLRLEVDSGREDQVRAQLAALGHPVAGDAEHGACDAPRLMLHVSELSLWHPDDGRRLRVHAPTPPEMTHWWSQSGSEPPADGAAARALVDAALAARWALGSGRAGQGATTAFRLINHAGDGLPGVALDVYDAWLVLHLHDVPAERVALVAEHLRRLGARGLYAKWHPRQANELQAEGARSELLWGAAAPAELGVVERAQPFVVRLDAGLRTGLFLDQRDNRARVRALARGARVLNVFAYTCTFSAAALAGGANEVISVDSSQAVLDWGQRNVELTGRSSRHRAWAADAFDALDELRRRGERFGLVIVDPPSYSTTSRGRFRVRKDYVALLREALRLTGPGGHVLACVNQRSVSQKALQALVRQAAEAAGRPLAKISNVGVQVDFPVKTPEQPQAKSVLLQLS